MSEVTSAMIRSVDYAGAAMRRRENHRFLEQFLGERNLLRITLSGDDLPLCYPFLSPRPMRRRSIDRGFYIQFYRPGLATNRVPGFAWERTLVSSLCLLPVDQRYNYEAMSLMADEVIEAFDQPRVVS